MIGNAVPVNFSYAIAQAIKEDLFSNKEKQNNERESYSPLQLSLNLL